MNHTQQWFTSFVLVAIGVAIIASIHDSSLLPVIVVILGLYLVGRFVQTLDGSRKPGQRRR